MSQGLRRLLFSTVALASAIASVATGAVQANAQVLGGHTASPSAPSPRPAAPVTSHEPFGGISSTAMHAGTLAVTGWAADPDALTANVRVSAVLDGVTTLARTVTSIPRPKIAAARHLGATPGFALSAAVPSGVHTVCIVASNVGPGFATLLRCITTPLGTRLSQGQLAAHSPVGSFSGVWAHPASVHVHGWASDPDLQWRHSTVVLYVDGTSAATFPTSKYSGPRPFGAGANSEIDATVPVSYGSHVVCLWVVNVGLGGNAFLGCRAVDTRGRAGSGPIPVPALNTKVVAEAKKHLGQRYVWGATGPKTFDCSGLVMYSYGKNGYATPRIAKDQQHAARLIPASRAVPGDLVFYSSALGDVYHVGIVTGPGISVAAVDPAEGVTWQRFWNDGLTFFGSFTHT